MLTRVVYCLIFCSISFAGCRKKNKIVLNKPLSVGVFGAISAEDAIDLSSMGALQGALYCTGTKREIALTSVMVEGNSLKMLFKPKEDISGKTCQSEVFAQPSSSVMEQFSFDRLEASGRATLFESSSSAMVEDRRVYLTYKKLYRQKLQPSNKENLMIYVKKDAALADLDLSALNLYCGGLEAAQFGPSLLTSTETALSAKVDKAILSLTCELKGISKEGQVYATSQVVTFKQSPVLGYEGSEIYILKGKNNTTTPTTPTTPQVTQEITVDGVVKKCPIDKVEVVGDSVKCNES